MFTLRDIQLTAESLMTKNPDPVVVYRLYSDVLQKSPADPVLREARQLMLGSPWVKELAAEQKEDGSWGRFHSEDTKIKARFRTSEAAIERGLALGLEADHPVFQQAIVYMQQVLTGEAKWSDWDEKNERWPLVVRLATAGTLATLEPTHPLLAAEWEFWLHIGQSAFKLGEYDLNTEKEAYRELLGIDVPISFLHTKYALNILATQPHRLPDGLEEHIVKWVLDKDQIRYIGTSLTKPRMQHLNSWFSAVELLSGFRSWKKYLEQDILWLIAQRNEHGLWDFPAALRTEYFPLSPNWRQKGVREIDYSLRVLAILRKFYETE